LQDGPIVLIDVSNAALRLLLAPECAACAAPLDRPLSGPICPACWRGVARLTPPWCRRCGDAVNADLGNAGPREGEHGSCVRCRQHPPAFEVARSAGRYDGALRQIIHAFKYANRRTLSAPLAALLSDVGRPLLEEADGAVPVPLHPWRRIRRGFNQADDLAQHLGLPILRVLRRCRHGPPQAGLPAGRRRANVRAAYAVRWRPAGCGVRGRVLVLVDDVMTTGATLDACSRALLEAGARSVRALTVARAVAGRPARSPR
jgi:ComF family protein